MGIKVFISYIRDDSAASAGWLHETMIKEFGRNNIFKDIDSIPLGADFKEKIKEEIQNCDILLAIIGTKFTKIKDKNGNPKIKNPNEFVNIEISSAINLGKRIIPVLVDNAKMPESYDLPANLYNFKHLHAINLRYDSWGRDTIKLFYEIKENNNKALLKKKTESKIRKISNTEFKNNENISTINNNKEPLIIYLTAISIFSIIYGSIILISCFGMNGKDFITGIITGPSFIFLGIFSRILIFEIKKSKNWAKVIGIIICFFLFPVSAIVFIVRLIRKISQKLQGKMN